MNPHSDENSIDEVPTVGFTLDTPEVTLKQLANIADDLHGLFREVQDSLIPTGRVRWIVDHISMASPLEVVSRPVSDDPLVPGPMLGLLSSSISGGLKQLQRQALRPPYFTDDALEKARDIVALVRKAEGTLTVDSVPLDEHVVANVNEMLGSVSSAIGSIEGRLESLNVHGSNRYFNVYDSLSGARIKCDFGHRIPADEVGAAAEKRVLVHGEIRYREDGEIVNVIARSIEVFPPEEELPSANDVLGILGG